MSPTSILKKVAMAITGLALFLFVIIHLAGNLLMISGPDAFNGYSDKLHSLGGLIYIAEVGLVVLVAMHAATAIRVTRENRSARPQRYLASATAGKATFASRSMAFGGLLLLAFLIIHVRAFRFGNASGPGGLWGLVVTTFKNPLVVGFYVVSMMALGLHLSHGIESALQTLGAQKPRWREPLLVVGRLAGWAIALGFAALPVWAYVAARVS